MAMFSADLQSAISNKLIFMKLYRIIITLHAWRQSI